MLKFLPILFFLNVILVRQVAPAQPPWREAPEKWRMPVKVSQLSAGRLSSADQPSLTPDGETMYYFHFIEDSIPAGIYKTVWVESSWSTPALLNSNVNSYLAEGPSINPNGNRLYFRSYGRPGGYGGWDLYYSDWDSVNQDWVPAVNLGPNINSDRDDWGCFTPDNKHLYWNPYGGQPRISVWSDSVGAWGPSQPVDASKFLGSDGRVAVPASRRKIYEDVFTGSEYHIDIYVHYYDTTTSQWGDPMWLNLNRMMDTLVNASSYGFRRIEAYPWISPDGHTLYFMSTHDSTHDIWMSKMVIDENGNPVTDVGEPPHEVPHEFELLQNYPNPFNPVTTIHYRLSKAQHVMLSIFNIIGERVKTIADTNKEAGEHIATWDGFDGSGHPVASGVYFCRLQSSEGSLVGNSFYSGNSLGVTNQNKGACNEIPSYSRPTMLLPLCHVSLRSSRLSFGSSKNAVGLSKGPVVLPSISFVLRQIVFASS